LGQRATLERLETWGLSQLRLLEPVAGGAVKQNAVPIRFPNGGELDPSGPVEAEKDPAGLSRPAEYPFGHLKGIDLKLMVLTKRFVDVIPKLFQTVEVANACQHLG
jgi:hypothetical protein